MNAVQAWTADGQAPPSGEPFMLTDAGTAIAQDSYGNALGGVRTAASGDAGAASSGDAGGSANQAAQDAAVNSIVNFPRLQLSFARSRSPCKT